MRVPTVSSDIFQVKCAERFTQYVGTWRVQVGKKAKVLCWEAQRNSRIKEKTEVDNPWVSFNTCISCVV